MKKRFFGLAIVCFLLFQLITPNISVLASEVNTENLNQSTEENDDFFMFLKKLLNINSGRPIIMKDSNLKKALNNKIDPNRPNIKNLTKEELESFKEDLDLSNLNIESIEGLQYCKNLKRLYLNKNKISDLNPLKDLTSLQTLSLSENNIKDLSGLKNLKNLNLLNLSNNILVNIDELYNLKELEVLILMNNNISDLTPLTNLLKLNYLILGKNKITDLIPIKNLEQLEMLNLGDNNISNINDIKNLSKLETLILENNFIEDITPLENLIELKDLNLYGNRIKNISALKNLNKLDYLYLSNQSIYGGGINKNNLKIKVSNIIQGLNNEFLEPTSTPDLYSYDKIKKMIVFKKTENNIEYYFNKTIKVNKMNAYFNGEVYYDK
ncbi:leucine-rich repeat domain-containing protein [Clostridium sardiniense]|uniref:leucine-rich repeat domain-containing protein n=1 Tax=Clostridium sardiniense TaxID=29369 RepID=UPI001956E7DF|nr:leucine-rich repeat domain-containing protein [Clostridium sardiniense]MBM7835573.1 Leucine-rich repeat (LRR) protein [Clostridium sardiniense]